MVKIKGELLQDSRGAAQVRGRGGDEGRGLRGGVFKAFPKERNRDKIQSGKNGDGIELMYFLGVMAVF